MDGAGRDLEALWITTHDGTAHLVRNAHVAEQWKDGDEGADGVFLAEWGAWVVSGSMCEPIGQPCPLCMPAWAIASWRTAN